MRHSKGRGNHDAAGGRAGATTTPPLTFSLPLKETSKPVAFPGGFQKQIALEFAMRYLNEIGATPTVENCKAVLREMPLEACSVTTAWRSRGCLADAIIIQPGGSRSGGGTGTGMGEASPPPAAESTSNNHSGKNERSTRAPERASQETQKGDVNVAGRHGRSNKSRERSCCTPKRMKAKLAATKPQPTICMGRANPHKVSVFVDAISSAIGPAIIEATSSFDCTRRNGDAATGVGMKAGSGILGPQTAAFQSSGTGTARERNDRRRRKGELAVKTFGTYLRGMPQGEEEQNFQRQCSRNPKDGISKNIPARANAAGGGEGQRDSENSGCILQEDVTVSSGVALAEARRKMLDPPKVDMAAIASIQTAFARNFPFQKHGKKFADDTLRSSLKNLITSEGPGRLIGLLSHYLFWIILLPFAMAHKDHDESILLRMGNRVPSNPQKKVRVKLTDHRAQVSTTVPGGQSPPRTTTSGGGRSGIDCNDKGSSCENDGERPGQGGGEKGRHPYSPTLKGIAWGGIIKTVLTRNRNDTAPEASPEIVAFRPKLTPEEAESLFVSVVEAWSNLRSSLGASRRARLVQLPIAVAAVRHGVQAVLSNCYPFLETKGGREGKRLLAAAHEEVTARFIPRFYYEGPFTPVADDESELSANNAQASSPIPATSGGYAGGGGARGGENSATVPATQHRRQKVVSAGPSSPSQPSTPPPVSSSAVKKNKRHFLENSSTLKAAPDSPGTSFLQNVPHVIEGSAVSRFSRDRPGGNLRTGEALFATSTTLGYVFPNPGSPEARKMIASRARARSSRDASRTTTEPETRGINGFGFTMNSPRSTHGRLGPSPPSQAVSTAGNTAESRKTASWARRGVMTEGPSSQVARRSVATATAGTTSHVLNPRFLGLGETSREGCSNSSSAATTSASATNYNICGRIKHDREEPATTSTRAVPETGHQHHLKEHQKQKRLQGYGNISPSTGPTTSLARGATANSRAEKTAKIHHHRRPTIEENPSPIISATSAYEPKETNRDGRGYGTVDQKPNIWAYGNVGVDVRVRVGDVGVGAAAKARLYRGFCDQIRGEYGREYRRLGGKETLGRIALLNNTCL